MLQKNAPIQCLGYLELVQNHLKRKGLEAKPFEFFGANRLSRKPYITFLEEFFNDTKGSLFSFLGHLELIQNYLKPTDPPVMTNYRCSLTCPVLTLTDVEIAVGSTFSVSESVSSMFKKLFCVFEVGAINFSISFWVSARILERSDMISLLSDVFVSSRLSRRILGSLLGPAMRVS